MTHILRAANKKVDERGGNLNKHGLVGLSITIFMFGGIVAWGAIADLHAAIIASGVVVVESNLKKIQHPTGGVVGLINVKDGQSVLEGDLLLRLDETVTRANLAIIVNQLEQLYGRRARLEAERSEAIDIIFPKSLLDAARKDSEAARVVAGEKNVFFARKAQRLGQKAQLHERIEQLRREIEGLDAQKDAKELEADLIKTELVGVEELYKKNLVPLARVSLLQREEARIKGERGALVAQAASTRGKINEIQLQIMNLDGDLRSEVARDLRDAEAKISELEERRITAEDQLRRVDLRSPVSGSVHQLAVHTVGGVIQPGELLMNIVPNNDPLVIEARIIPNDIDPVHVGAKARIRLTSFNQATTPELEGNVVHVAGDLSKDAQTGAPYFATRISMQPSELKKLGSQRLVPGMPAEVFIQTTPRTAISYLFKPVTDQFVRAMKER